ncbi:hypothetical protein U732_2293 [Clostridium argentinense CDC 2741]|uniref:Uncharacterized protein n=1 Tax=Clostridium argentinense CDC 2741 TaxID=1418104 RepID=A0A0C1UEB9_9CLOT|nr:hypothetical protein [Clostridium argentinense]ARC83379.1 hypothetical protein RSJ17_01890 [Clostridium argentinense]KIE45750.1 hypothetical protein U732_2293 [Clostridium argentinense CDC 2741]NFF39178.1 hypothetical protein [Clostridium argentinense]NFP49590.1 hypothetical protein [Clostridium argentinense]NFP72293.1 hypothetical protein [Clostridium argentinense]
MKIKREFLIVPMLIILLFSSINVSALEISKVTAIMSGGAIGHHHKTELISTSNSSHEFIDYHPLTPNWRKASSYIITDNVKGLKYKEISSLLKSKLKNELINISADSTRFNRIGIYCDFIVSKHKGYRIENWSGKVVDTWEFTVKTPINAYMEPVYKQ